MLGGENKGVGVETKRDSFCWTLDWALGGTGRMMGTCPPVFLDV